MNLSSQISGRPAPSDQALRGDLVAAGPVQLSICLATFNRAKFIGSTLDSILSQIEAGVEVVIVDGASPDNTTDIVAEYLANWPLIRYFREEVNSGIDADYDKAVSYARGQYCWLMTDDDLLKPGAVRSILSAIAGGHDLVVVNSEVWNSDYSSVLTPRFAAGKDDASYLGCEVDRAFSDLAGALSFIGCVIIRRSIWLSRSRSPYYGTLFVHVGVIFQSPPLAKVFFISDPLISIRYGNAMWSPRGFEIWMFKWPALIWSFTHVSQESKSSVSSSEPWRQSRKLLLYRAIGGYDKVAYRRHIRSQLVGLQRLVPALVAMMPARMANAIASGYCLFFARGARLNVYDLARSKNSSWTARLAARLLRISWSHRRT